MIDRHLQSMILRGRGDNRKLCEEILEKLSAESKERLFRIFQDHENEEMRLKAKAKMPFFR